MVWPSRQLSRADHPPAPATCSTASASLGLADHRADDLADRPVLAPSSTAAASSSSRWRRCWSLVPLAHPACRLGPSLGWKPLRWVGVRSYGIYLWHLPIIVLTTPRRHRQRRRTAARAAAGGGDLRRRGALLALRRGADPPRRARPLLAPRRARGGWRPASFAPRGLGAGRRRRPRPASPRSPAWPGSTRSRPKAKTPGSKKRAPPAPTKPPPLTPAQAADSTSSSCKAVVHIGDSTSEGLDLGRIPARPESQRIEAQYADVGATEQRLRDRRRPLDRRALRRRTERPGSGRSVEGRRLQRLLGAGARHQRGGRRLRRLQRRRAANGSKT